MSKVIISADCTCDINPEIQERYNIQLLDWRIELDGKEYVDNVEIFPDDLYKAWREKKILPRSSAATLFDFKKHFEPLLAEGYEIVHLDLGSGISSTYQNCCTAAKELGNVYPVDTQNLSSGTGHLVIEAAKLAEQGKSGAEIQKAIEDMCSKVHTSFLLDTLEFMKAGGRCSSVVALGANLLKLKPCIEVDNQNGSKMAVGKKYRGDLEKCIRQYVNDKLAGRDDINTERLFIAHSGSPDSDIHAAVEEAKKLHDFQEVYVTRASCVISTHCGPRTLGLFFMTK